MELQSIRRYQWPTKDKLSTYANIRSQLRKVIQAENYEGYGIFRVVWQTSYGATSGHWHAIPTTIEKLMPASCRHYSILESELQELKDRAKISFPSLFEMKRAIDRRNQIDQEADSYNYDRQNGDH